jgi:hypothetical protein
MNMFHTDQHTLGTTAHNSVAALTWRLFGIVLVSGIIINSVVTLFRYGVSSSGGVTGDFFRGIRQFHVPEVDSTS